MGGKTIFCTERGEDSLDLTGIAPYGRGTVIKSKIKNKRIKGRVRKAPPRERAARRRSRRSGAGVYSPCIVGVWGGSPTFGDKKLSYEYAGLRGEYLRVMWECCRLEEERRRLLSENLKLSVKLSALRKRNASQNEKKPGLTDRLCRLGELSAAPASGLRRKNAEETQSGPEALLIPEIQPAAPARRAAHVPLKETKTAGPAPEAKTRRIPSLIFSVIFYLATAGILFSAVVYTAGNKGMYAVFGYAFYEVVSESMQREIPKGSLIFVKAIDPGLLSVGDDITYLRSNNGTVTHRIIRIIENCDNSGGRGFVTKGLENMNPDENVVPASEVVGKVRWRVPALGFILTYMAERVTIVFMIFGALIAASLALSAFSYQ